MAEKVKSVFDTLNEIDVSEKTAKKGNLTYLSWSDAWGEVKKRFPDTTYTVYERETQYGPVNYFTDGRTCWVKTGVTINGIEHIEELYVMDYRGNSIQLSDITSKDINKTIQRSITKAIARHGLGLYIYAGEDLPDTEENRKKTKEEREAEKAEFEKNKKEIEARKLAELDEEAEQIKKDAASTVKTAKKIPIEEAI